LCCILLLVANRAFSAEPTAADPVLAAMRAELNRLSAELKKAPVPIYFLSYQLTDNWNAHVSASFGALTTSQEERTRVLDTDVRVGDYVLDNTHRRRGGERFGGAREDERHAVPLDDDADALRVTLWKDTERRYRAAVRSLASVNAEMTVKVEQEDRSADFSREAAETHYEPPVRLGFDRRAWEAKVRGYSKRFAGHKEIIDARAGLTAEIETRRYVNTDGGCIQTSSPRFRLVIKATAKAADGMELPLQTTYMSFRPDGFPDDAAIEKDVGRMVQTLLALAKAPVAEAYIGPAILSGRASAVFFHEIFGHRVEGQRQKNEEEAQTFRKKLNHAVLPAFLSVYSDPSLRELGGTDLGGFYRYDDEGVKAQRVQVVQRGILKAFLMSRAPIDGFAHSNGHGRRQQGFPTAARQSNLIVESTKRLSREALKRALLARVKAGGNPYGLLFDDIEGGFTFTVRILPNAFNVRPTIVYRVYPDGREELVRGVDLIGTPLIALSKIVATDDQVAVFNGICGAESGWVPVSAVSPGLLVSQIEVQRKEKSQERAPLLPPPPSAKEMP
jgi:predicted Zn-dependent protease